MDLNNNHDNMVIYTDGNIVITFERVIRRFFFNIKRNEEKDFFNL